MKILYKKSKEVSRIVLNFEDKIHFGDKIIDSERNIYEVDNPIFYKYNLFLYESDSKKISNSFVKNVLLNNKIILCNINYPFPVKRSQLNLFKLQDVYKISKIKVLELERPAYLFVMNKAKAQNYWHSLIDNFSDLLNVLEHIKGIDVLCNVDGLSKLNHDYLYFLKKIFNFNLINIGDNNYELKGKIIYIDTGVQHKLNLENNLETANKINDRAKSEAEKIFKGKINRKLFKFGLVPHSYELIINGKKKILKNYIIPYTTPYRFSIFTALNSLKNKIGVNKNNKYKRIFIVREKENENRNKKQLKNFESLKFFLISYGFTFVTFENYSFEEQIKIIDNCELLVGIHGAGFTNMVFMNKNTKIVDITPYYYSLPRTEEFKIICEILGLEYNAFYTKNNINAESEYEIDEFEFKKLIKKNIDD